MVTPLLGGCIKRLVIQCHVPDNLGCDRNSEMIYWCLRREVEGEEKESVETANFNQIDECLNDWEVIYKMMGRCDLLIIIMGSNDIASRPQSLQYHLAQLI